MKHGIDSLIKNDGFLCDSCGKRHFGKLKDCIIRRGAVYELPSLLKKYGVSNPYILCDRRTYEVAGELVCKILTGAGISYAIHIIEREHPAPDERIVGEAMMYCPLSCDSVIAVGGGVINDTGKVIASAKNVPDIIVGTAPSMDGFASATSSMERGGLKVSINTKCPDAVIGDPQILASAPKHMIASGIGDMLAKYVSLVEWKIARVILDEYYCPAVSEMVEEALAVCVKSAAQAVNGDEDALCAVMEGLVISGLAMNYAGVSRPASGMEHYISHIIDMRALEFGTPWDLHGIQCGIATLETVRAYEKLAKMRPDMEYALKSAREFDLDKWNDHLREKLGKGAEIIIEGDLREQKYDITKHEARIKRICEKWDEVVEIIDTLPSSSWLLQFMRDIGHPTSFTEIGLTDEDMHEAFAMAKDIRDKYVLGKLMWDMGVLE
ncbi:MAG: sn-glycerol-1-phosphate dehydrogenase [Ruminococcaceae bacterium]|nr:sn-glycerol-1-phosphate dehydrogenase [Oscillospiraceae bacterium]